MLELDDENISNEMLLKKGVYEEILTSYKEKIKEKSDEV